MISRKQQRSQNFYIQKKNNETKLILPDHFNVLERLGKGSFGEIYKVFNKSTNQVFAVKVENKSDETNEFKYSQGMIQREFKIMQVLQNEAGFARGIQIISMEQQDGLVMQYLGSSLEKLRKTFTKLSKQSVYQIGIIMFSLLETFHSYGIIHRDLKPDNILIGGHDLHHFFYLIDYGLSHKYVNSYGEHIPMEKNKGMVGTIRYTSINSHFGYEQSRRDDLESLGNLPWQNVKGDDNEPNGEAKKTKIKNLKINIDPTNLDNNLMTILKYVKDLEFHQKPDYKKIIQILRTDIQDKWSCYEWCDSVCNSPHPHWVNDKIKYDYQLTFVNKNNNFEDKNKQSSKAVNTKRTNFEE